MIDLMVKNIFQNSNKIDTIIKHINKTDKRYCLMFLLVTANIYVGTKIMNKQEQRISDLENELKEMKSKGE